MFWSALIAVILVAYLLPSLIGATRQVVADEPVRGASTCVETCDLLLQPLADLAVQRRLDRRSILTSSRSMPYALNANGVAPHCPPRHLYGEPMR